MPPVTEREPVIVTRASLAPPDVVQSAVDSDLPDDWTNEDRERVKALYFEGFRQLDDASDEARRKDGDAAEDVKVMVAPDAREAALLQAAIQELAWDGALDTVALPTGQVEVIYDPNDPHWVFKVVGWVRATFGLGRFDFLKVPALPTEIASDCRIAILGDWGTGTYGAPYCAATIQGDNEGFDLVVHLGDVYYGGGKEEVEANFLRRWPQPDGRNGRPPISRACNSNHEMYSGGKPYAELTLPRFDQSSSAFALENEHWLLVGLDTAYDEWHLAGGQVKWLKQLLAREGDRRVILFSHHPPMSHFKSPNHDFVRIVDEVINAARGRVAAWYFGHEHIGAIFEQHARWNIRGRCVGHSGYPYLRRSELGDLPPRPPVDTTAGQVLVEVPARDGTPCALVVDGPNPYISNDDRTNARYGPNGFMTVSLRGRDLHEELLTADGKLLVERDS